MSKPAHVESPNKDLAITASNEEPVRQKKPGVREEHAWEIGITIVAVLAITAIAYVPTFRGEELDAGKAGLFGDFIGGYIGTLVLVISAAFICASFLNQRRTNERTAFESRFFELLKFHRENVSEIGIGSKITGRRVFVSLIREFRMCLELVHQKASDLKISLSNEQKIDLAYMAFYYGVGPNSTRILEKALGNRFSAPLVAAVVARMGDEQMANRGAVSELARPTLSEVVRADTERFLRTSSRVSYPPYEGHQSRLAHYYRHLYQMMKYVRDHAPDKTAREYAGIVRAQLTNHEQALLCMNALSEIGRDWEKEKFLVGYEMIKNIPRDFFNPAKELDLEKRFPNLKFEFKAGESGDGPNRAPVSADEADPKGSDFEY